MERFTISRRQFLGGMFCLTCLPAKLFASNGDDVVLRMAVMSDVHVPNSPDAVQLARLRKGLTFVYDWSAAQPYKNFDALLVAGDMSDHGYSEELTFFKNTMDDVIRPETAKILCMGNHEFYSATHESWMEIFGIKDTDRYEVNGHTIIALSPEKGTCRDGDYCYKLDWLREQLEAAAKADPKKPIFLFQHYHVSETVYGSLNGDNWGTNDLRELLDQYPQVIDFSGHSHYPINDPRSVWQGKFTAFGTGTLSYFEMEGGHYEKFPAGHGMAAQFYIVEVHADHSVVVRPFDILSGDFFDSVYLVAEPGNEKKYLYTDRRYETASAPVWKEGTTVAVEEPTHYGATLSFEQASDETVVHSYRVDMTKETSSGEMQVDSVYKWSEYYFQPMPNPMRLTIESLDPGAKYHLKIAALNPFGKESAEKLEAVIETLPMEDHSDKTAAFPVANLLAMAVVDGKLVNRAAGNPEFEGREILTIGKPAAAADLETEREALQFDGENDYLKYPFSKSDEVWAKNQVTLAARFKFDEWRRQSILSNTETGGYSLELNLETKQLEFWLHLNGTYHVLSADCEAGKWHTAFGVYDGENMILYLDGEETAREAVSEKITYTANNNAQAVLVGADINSNGDGGLLFQGKIASADLFGWGLSAEQVKNLSAK